MWADNETSDDLLGFQVHCDLIHNVVTDRNVLPVVIGVFGDWGGGKSSIMKMLEKKLEADPKTACLYFNGWMFEGYEDAKTALLTSILIALGENKRFGEKIRDEVGGLLRRIKWMDLGRLAVTHIAPPIAIGLATGGVGAVPAVLGSLASGFIPKFLDAVNPAQSHEKADGKKEGINWRDYLADEKQPDLLEVRKFREDFEKLLAKCDIESLVILIDDLDRCLPDRIIETLEAIKLFVAVPKTAFVIGADARIVRHAIATRYARQQLDPTQSDEDEEYDLTKDYLEKLIQIPYHLPRLSPTEMESYINLLLCQNLLPEEAHKTVVARWHQKRQGNFYMALNYGEVQEALGSDGVSDELSAQLEWSNRVAQALTEGLKGNPRQVKRMLNAMQLRRRLSHVANLDIKPDVLAKLMVLEYTENKLFRRLDNWQTVAQGHPPELQQLETAANKEEGEVEEFKGDFVDWNHPWLRRWLQMPPLLGAVDLRDYFWIARDRTKSTLSEASMVSPLVNRVYRGFIGAVAREQTIAVQATRDMTAGERAELLDLLSRHLQRHPDEDAAPDSLKLLIVAQVEGAESALFEALQKVPIEPLSPGAVQNIASLAQSHPALRAQVLTGLERIASKPDSLAGASAKVALEDLNEA